MQVQNQEKSYLSHLKILPAVLQQYDIQITEDVDQSIHNLRKLRKEKGQELFPKIVNSRLLETFTQTPSLDRAPIWMMRQAGRYLPEFMGISKDFGFFEKCENPFLASEITLQPIQRFDIDAAIIFADILTLPKAMGMEISMAPKEGPVIHNPLQTPDDIGRIKKPDPTTLEFVYDALYLTRLALQGKQSLIGFCGAPWTVFAYMVEGGGSKLFTKAKKWLYLYQEGTQKVLDMLAEASAEYLINQVNAGAQVVQIFDSWAGEIPSYDYIRVILPSLLKLGTLFKKVHPKTPIIMFPRGACSVEVIQEFVKMRLDEQTVLFDGFNLDHSISLEVIELLTKESRTLQGNMEPGVLYGEQSFIRERCQLMIEKLQTTSKYIVNLAHGLTPEHKPDKVKIFVDEVQQASRDKNKQGYQSSQGQ